MIMPDDRSGPSGGSQRLSQGKRQKPTATLIIFYLPAGESSTWHRVKSDEIWIWNGMGKLELQLGGRGDRPDEGQGEVIQLGDPREGREVQGVVPAGVWQRTLRGTEDVLVSCMVSPGFDFEDFEILDAE
jgi:predicted cupin superfamily sugar epimerase